jgi:hypothetical protein
MTIEIALPDEIASKLERTAQDRGVSVSELVFYCVIEKLERDSEFKSAADDVLLKNTTSTRGLPRNRNREVRPSAAGPYARGFAVFVRLSRDRIRRAQLRWAELPSTHTTE